MDWLFDWLISYCFFPQAFYTDPLSEDAPRLVAVKQLKQVKSDRNVASIMEEMRSEMEIMKSLQHESIVDIVGVCVDPVPLLIMEFVENGALNSFLRKNQSSVDVTQLLAFAKDVANGMAYLQVPVSHSINQSIDEAYFGLSKSLFSIKKSINQSTDCWMRLYLVNQSINVSWTWTIELNYLRHLFAL